MRDLRILIAVSVLTLIISVALSLDAVTLIPGLGGVVLGTVLLRREVRVKKERPATAGRVSFLRRNRSAA